MWSYKILLFSVWNAAFASTTSSLLDCSFRSDGHMVGGNDDLILHQIINPDNQTVSIELTYAGLGWIGIAFVESASMVPATSIIGLPDAGTVAKYDMTERSTSGVTMITDATEQAAITNASIEQNDTHTVLKFTKPLIESGEVSVLQGSENLFIWGYGADNNLGYHASRGSDSLVFDECIEEGSPASAPVTAESPSTSASSSLLDCSFRSDGHMVGGSDDLILHQIINQDNQTVSIELTYSGLGWIGIAFVESASMVPAMSIIGLPDDGTVAKYDMTERSTSGVSLLTDATEQAAITNASIEQNGTHTNMKFTKPLMESGEVSVLQGSENLFIWGYGSDNNLGYHASRGSDSLVFDECVVKGAPVSAPVPTTKPVSSPIAAPVTKPVSSAASGRIERNFVLADDLVTLNIVGDAISKTLTVEMTYDGLAWMSFAISKTGQMTDSTAIIGLPSNSAPVKYDMSARAISGVNQAPDNRQTTLTDTEFKQNETHTYMKFTKPLVEDGDISVLLDGSDNFLYAFGSGNSLAIHDTRASFVFAQCDPTVEDCGSVVESEAPNRSKWIAHGVCMALAWAILIPLGIGSSILRSLLPSGGIWFQLHRGLNVVGILLVIAGFSIAVSIINKDGASDHFSANRHQTIGLVVTIFAFVQGINGALRPHAPTPAAAVTPGDAEQQDHTTDDSNHSTEKTKIRSFWEIGHRIFGMTTLGLAWYNCDLGFELFDTRFGDEDNFAASGKAFWPVVGSISGLIFVLAIYSKFIQKKKTDASQTKMGSSMKQGEENVPHSSTSIHM